MITLHACTACGHPAFPARKLCHRCGGAAWTELPCDHGRVEAVTMVQPATLLAEVRIPNAVRLIARLQLALPPGASVTLHEAEDGALWGTQ